MNAYEELDVTIHVKIMMYAPNFLGVIVHLLCNVHLYIAECMVVYRGKHTMTQICIGHTQTLFNWLLNKIEVRWGDKMCPRDKDMS